VTDVRHVAVIMRVRGLSRSEAERFADENTIVDCLNATHPDTPFDRCEHCGKRETPDAILLPIGVAFATRGCINAVAIRGPKNGTGLRLRSWRRSRRPVGGPPWGRQ
jgi:hypothetical protein